VKNVTRRNRKPHSEQLRFSSPTEGGEVPDAVGAGPEAPGASEAQHASRGSGARDESRRRFQRLVDLLKAYFELLKLAQASRGTVDSLGRLVNFLSAADDELIRNILSRAPAVPETARPSLVLADEDIRSMPTSEIEALLARPDVRRKTLEQVAAVRFFMTRGELSSTPNRAALIEKLLALVENERTRQTIQKLASGEPTPATDVQEQNTSRNTR